MTLEFVIDIVLALVLGSLVGIERQWHRHVVDLKTNALVALGACLFMLACRTPVGFDDPIRMAAQIVVGVGFLGGGLLFRSGEQTRGINTAATLWCCAAVGTLCGLQRWLDATIASAAIIAANTILRRIARALDLRMGLADQLTDLVRFELVCRSEDQGEVAQAALAFFAQRRREVRAVRHTRLADSRCRISMDVAFEHGEFRELAGSSLEDIAGGKIAEVSWSLV